MNTDFAKRPVEGEYAAYYQSYLDLAHESDVVAAMENQLEAIRKQLDGVPESMFDVLHEPYTWTIKQAIGHVLDTERIFGYRAGCFAANDPTDLPGYDENRYVINTDYSQVGITELMDELEHLRRANIAMFKRMQPEYWDRAGNADGKSITVRAIAYILVGHVRHHFNIFAKRLAV